ncbi:bifunctional pyr operon transcriptional regulator/uracil phosphoribosyltransferase PyrR [bacterium]|nr:bifunctional pyr operon transcriptional regulator/uracil phosphoribosyltransferase PyrR [bacterium]
MGGRKLLDANGLGRAIAKLADSIIEKGKTEPVQGELAIVGIRRRGVPLGKRVVEELAKRTGKKPLFGALDITLYRDDLTLVAEQPIVSGSEVEFPVEGKRVVLVDDVLFTGRTVRAAIDALLDLGRPKKIELAVVVDRGWRELPIEANHVAERVQTTLREVVKVHVKEQDGDDGAEIVTAQEDVK